MLLFFSSKNISTQKENLKDFLDRYKDDEPKPKGEKASGFFGLPKINRSRKNKTPKESREPRGKFKWPTAHQWRQLLKNLNHKEKIIVFSLVALVVVSTIILIHGYYLAGTIKQPAVGGDYIEGIVGSPQYLNPVLAQSNDPDRHLSRILFSSLFKYDASGNLVGDLAERYEIGDDGKIIDVWLKQNFLWHDKEKVTADDVIFTIKSIQDPAFKSPLRPTLSGVEVEKIEDYYIRLTIKDSYVPFLQNLNFGILPKHIWQNISASQFLLNELNLKPIGSGPYVFSALVKNKKGSIQSITLKAFKNYAPGQPYLKTLKFIFFGSRQETLDALYEGSVEGIGSVPLPAFDQISSNPSLKIHSLKIPRYFSVFLNQNQSTALADKNVRLALNYATNKQEILTRAIKNEGSVLEGPITPGLPGYSEEVAGYEFDPQKAIEILEKEGWKDEDGDGIREKEGENLTIGLATLDWPELKEAAELIKEQWQEIGVNVDLKIEDKASLHQTIIRPRQYQALLYGELLSKEPDFLAFWHSSRMTDPGLNIALFNNKEVDRLITEARQEFNEAERVAKYKKIQQLIIDDASAVFLYSQNYLFVTKKQIKGTEMEIVNTPSERFNFVDKWYTKTERVWK